MRPQILFYIRHTILYKSQHVESLRPEDVYLTLASYPELEHSKLEWSRGLRWISA